MNKKASSLRRNKPLIKYLCVGVLAFTIEYLSFRIFFHFGMLLALANSLSFGLGLLTSFSLNRLWTFSNKSYAKKAHNQLVRYIILAMINLALTNLIVEGLNALGYDPELGKIIAMISTSLWNFILLKIAVFGHEKVIVIDSGLDSQDNGRSQT